MNPELLIGLAGLCITVGGIIYKVGQHSQRLSDAESDIKDLHGKADKAAEMGQNYMLVTQALETVRDTVKDIQHDVKNLLTGKVLPASRRRSGED